MEENDKSVQSTDTGLSTDTGQTADTEQSDDAAEIADTALHCTSCEDEPPDDMALLDDAGQANSNGKANNTGQSSLANQTEGELISSVTDAFLEQLRKLPRSQWPSPEQLGGDVVRDMDGLFTLVNINRGKGCGFPIPRALLPGQIAIFMATMFHIVRIAYTGIGANPDQDVLSIYMEDGPDEGTYVESKDIFHQTARRFNRWLTASDCDRIIDILRTLKEVPRVERCTDMDKIAVNNGIFDYKKKVLLPFSSSYVFTTKSRVNYNPNAKNVIIHNDEDDTDWDVESWIDGLSDDPEIVSLIWELLGAIIRPYVPWNKSAWFYSTVGNNGKGTLCVLMRGLCGEGAVAAITIKEFDKEFALEPLTRAVAIIADENDVGTYIDKAANLKAVITNDIIPINRKFKSFISFRFYGFMVQCLNEFPRIRDKSDSFYRRQLFVPFNKCFTDQERTYIKQDYLHRSEVLEYVLHRVLHMNYYKLSNPASCQEVLNEYKLFNDPVRQFFQEMERQFRWKLLPFPFLYALYKSWFSKNCPNGKVQGRNTFINEVINVTKDSQIWHCPNKNNPIRSAGRMNLPEPLILEYELNDWVNPNYCGSNVTLLATTAPKDQYRGLTRRDDPLDDDDDFDSTEDIND